MTATTLAQRLSKWSDIQIEHLQRKLEEPARIKSYRLYGKSILLPMVSMSVFGLILIALLILKMLTMPVIYYGGKKNGDD